MPFVFIIVGLLFIIAAVRGESGSLVTLIKGDFTGSDNFIYWFLSILVVGAVGYIKDLQGLSRAFLVLLIVVLLLNKNNQGVSFFNQFESAIKGVGNG